MICGHCDIEINGLPSVVVEYTKDGNGEPIDPPVRVGYHRGCAAAELRKVEDEKGS